MVYRGVEQPGSLNFDSKFRSWKRHGSGRTKAAARNRGFLLGGQAFDLYGQVSIIGA
jgi:hypothetical protein